MTQQQLFDAPRAGEWVSRLLDRIEVSPEGCWVFTGGLTAAGYGRLSVNGTEHYTHRLACDFWNGAIGELTVDHLCRVRACCNPAHLEAVTAEENKRRGESFAARNARKTHCRQGHEFTPENTYVSAQGWRKCRVCKRARDRAAWRAT